MGGVLTAEDSANYFGVSQSDLDDSPLFRLELGGDQVYPAFQLSGLGLLPGFEELVRAFTVENP